MNTLLIDAQGSGRVGRALVEWIPLSIRSISGILEKKGLNFDIAFVEEFLKNREKYSAYDLFLITGMSSDAQMIKRASCVIDEWKKPLVVGGSITFDPYSVLKKAKADIAIIGEGETTFLALLEAGLSEGDLPEDGVLSRLGGIAYKSDDEIKISYPKRFLSHDELNRFRPSTKVVEYYPFYQNIQVVLGILRGCSNFHKPKTFQDKVCIEGCDICQSNDLRMRMSCPQGIPPGCAFCSVPSLYGPPRSRDQEVITEEVKDLIKRGVTKISILDPDPLDYKREELTRPQPLTDPNSPEPNYEEIEKLGEMLWDLPEIADESVVVTIRDVKATLVTKRSAALIKKYFPLSVVGLGCESGSKAHCIELGRPHDPEKVLDAAKILNNHGIRPKVNFIVGLPGQSEKTSHETLELMNRLEEYILYFELYRFEALPMTVFDDKQSDTGPLQDENSKLMVSKSNSIQKRLFEKFIGKRWKAVIGVYDQPREQNLKREGPDNRPKRGFRQLAGVVGYPIFQIDQLSLYATIVKITNPSGILKTGDIRTIEVTGVSQLGFRMVLEGEIVQ